MGGNIVCRVGQQSCTCENLTADANERPNGTLVLAPLDGYAERALIRLLDAGGISYSAQGAHLLLDASAKIMASIRELASTSCPAALLTRIRAAVLQRGQLCADTLQALVEADPLATFFERHELSWAVRVLQERRLTSVFQPVVAVATGQILGYEALVRGRDDKSEGLISAGQLMYAYERLQLIQEFDRQARASAVRCAAGLGGLSGNLFVNVTPAALYDAEHCLGETLEEAAQVGISLDRLVFEIVGMDRYEDAQHLDDIVTFCRERGVRVALDDVDSSLFSLQQIARVRPNFIKVDGDVVACAVSASGRAKLASILETARSLDVAVVAEGIESEQQLHICAEVGVEFAQGFLLARPASPPLEVRPGLFQCSKAA